MAHRSCALRAGTVAATGLPDLVVLSEVGAGDGDKCGGARARHRRGIEVRARARAGQGAAAQVNACISTRGPEARLILPPATGSTPFQGGRSGAYPQYSSRDPHTVAEVCPRKVWYCRTLPRLSHVS